MKEQVFHYIITYHYIGDNNIYQYSTDSGKCYANDSSTEEENYDNIIKNIKKKIGVEDICILFYRLKLMRGLK